MHSNYHYWRDDKARLSTFRAGHTGFAFAKFGQALDGAPQIGGPVVGRHELHRAHRDIRQEPAADGRWSRPGAAVDAGRRDHRLAGGVAARRPGCRSPATCSGRCSATCPTWSRSAETATGIRSSTSRRLDAILALRPETLVTGHFDPIEGADRIAEEVTAMRDAMQWVHDRTVEGMEAGKDVHTLMRDVTVPEHLDVGEGYGRTAWNVRAIWEMYAGWFHHRSTTELYPVAPTAVAADLVSAAGAEQLVDAARARLAAGRTASRRSI